MFRKLLLLTLCAAVITALPACKKKKTAAEMQAEKVSAFRLKQKGRAIQVYTDLVTKYPDSEFAPKAKERLAALGPMPSTPDPKKKK